MINLVLPLQLILFQLLFLLVAIALEAMVFHQRLHLTRKTSVEYATSLNLWSVVIGWLFFLLIENFSPKSLQAQIVSYIFFDHPIYNQLEKLDFIIISIGIIIFFFSFIIKMLGFELIKIWIHDHPEQFESNPEALQKRPRLLNRDKIKKTKPKPNPAFAVLVANAYTYSAILFLLVLRFMEFHPVF